LANFDFFPILDLEKLTGMPAVNFYLKKSAGPLPWCLIYLQFKYSGQKLVYSFGQKINPVDWSKTQKRVKSSRQTILDGRYAINELLDKLEKLCIKTWQEESAKGVPPVSVLKFRLDAFIRQNKGHGHAPDFYRLFDRFISGEMKNKGRDKSPNTLKNYATTREHLQQFDLKTRHHVNFENINLDFFHKYVSFLQNDLDLGPNSVAKDISVLKIILSAAVEMNYTTNIQFRHKKFSFVARETEVVFLTEKEIATLYHCDLSGNKRLGQVRDLFVLGCLTGHRFSGQSAGSYIPAQPPAHPIATEIGSRYRATPGGLPVPPSNQKFNAYIKEACRQAGLTQKGRLPSDPGLQLWECISSHTARRSMASNAWLSGIPAHEIMQITGHRTEKAFLDYIRAATLPERSPSRA